MWRFKLVESNRLHLSFTFINTAYKQTPLQWKETETSFVFIVMMRIHCRWFGSDLIQTFSCMKQFCPLLDTRDRCFSGVCVCVCEESWFISSFTNISYFTGRHIYVRPDFISFSNVFFRFLWNSSMLWSKIWKEFWAVDLFVLYDVYWQILWVLYHLWGLFQISYLLLN